MICQLEQKDALRFLGGIPRGSVDLIVTDPAYESLEKHRAKGTTTRLAHSKASSNDWFPIFSNVHYPEFFRACGDALKPNAHLYVMCDEETLFVIKPIAERMGFKFWKSIIWRKVTKDGSKVRAGMGYHYRNSTERIAFFEKGKRKLNDLGVPDVLDAPRVQGGYPTEKPVSICRTLIEQSSNPGELVVDPFCGSSPVGEAALRAGRRFAGADISPAAIELSKQRLLSLMAPA